MKSRVIDSLPLPLHTLLSNQCEQCGYDFIILRRPSPNEPRWACLGEVAFCPNCGSPKGYAAEQSAHPTRRSVAQKEPRPTKQPVKIARG